jgi:hypothetical protein
MTFLMKTSARHFDFLKIFCFNRPGLIFRLKKKLFKFAKESGGFSREQWPVCNGLPFSHPYKLLRIF